MWSSHDLCEGNTVEYTEPHAFRTNSMVSWRAHNCHPTRQLSEEEVILLTQVDCTLNGAVGGGGAYIPVMCTLQFDPNPRLLTIIIEILPLFEAWV